MRNLLKWLDDNILSILAGFLLVFIPLYPKLPLFDILPGYIVRVRLEDFFVSFSILVWIVWIIRGKTKLTENPLFKPILIYLIIGFLSMISAIFIIETVPLETIHIQKIFLHYLRRIEYFSLFFIFFSTIKSLRTLKIYIGLLVVTTIAVTVYGFGQKYLFWPAFSTMNREFSKGWMLYLTSHARVLSTFGGHYDLAAFTMMILVMLWSLFFAVKRWLVRLFFLIVIATAFWLLILTASRTSFIAYLFGITALFFLWSFRRGINWAAKRWVAVTLLSIVIMLSFGDLSERFTKLLKIDERISGIKSLVLSPIGKPPQERAFFLENNPDAALAWITSKTDQPPTPLRPSDVYQDIPLLVPIGPGSSTYSAVSRTYSKTAFMYDLSTAIRFDALWPMAIAGFKRNPLLGSGYSTLNKIQQNQFTEAESTDNDYLRSLGETGILGFISFFGILGIAFFYLWRNLVIVRDPILFSIVAGLGGLLLGLLVNAAYIDVFESSKVAFSFWSVTGFVFGGIALIKRQRKEPFPFPVIPDLNNSLEMLKAKVGKFIRSDFFIVSLILFLAFILRLYKINTPLADWHSWRQADTSSVTRNYVRQGINILYPTYQDLSNVASGVDNPRGLRLVEFPLYNIASLIVDKIFVGYNIEISGRLTSIFATLGTIIFLFLITRKYLGKKEAIISCLFYSILPFNIYFTRVILPEPFLIFTSVGMIYFFDQLIVKIANFQSSNLNLRFILKIIINLILAFLFTISSLLIKPFAIFLFIPLAYLWFRKLDFSWRSILGLLGYWVIGLLPFVWWRWWIGHFPEGIPAYSWLLNGDGIRFKGAFFYWIFAERLVKLILGYWGLPLFLLGILSRIKKEGWLFYWWGIAMLLYVTVVATGNVRHDYYQIITIPIIAVFLAKGVVLILNFAGTIFSRFAAYFLLAVTVVFMMMFAWYHIRDFYNINHPEIVEAGNAVERKTSGQALVVAPYNGDTAFLYHTHRAGWPIVEDSIEKMIKLGADYYVSVNFDSLTKELIDTATLVDPEKRRFKIIEQTEKYVIIQLVPDNQLPR